MGEKKTLLLLVLALAALAAIWWGGWFGPITEQFLNIKRHTTYR
jgi:hypothetical protein